MRRLLQQIYDVSRYDTAIGKDRAKLTYTVMSVMFLVVVIFIPVIIISPGSLFGDNPDNPKLYTFLFAIYFIGLSTAFILTRRGNGQAGGLLVVLIAALTLGGISVTSGAYTMQDGMFMFLILALAGLLLEQRGLILGVVLVLGLTVAALSIRPFTPYIPSESGYEFIVVLLLTVVASSLIYGFLRFARISRVEGAASAELERMRMAQLTSLITNRISRRLALGDVLRNAVEEIRQIYPDIYHVQIFLTEPGGNARLVASTGEVGKMLIERQHSLPIGSQSVIGQVTANSQFVIAHSNSGNSVHRRNEFLPDTVVEAAFPLRIGDAVIGALDLQSKRDEAFVEEDTPIFQSLADNVAIAIDNARLFEETERRLVENQQLVAQMRQSTEEVERLNERLTGRFWKDFLNQQDTPSLNLDLETRVASDDSGWTPTIKQAIESNQSVQTQSTDVNVVTVPLRVRGQVIGAMEFEMDEKGNLSDEDLAMMEEVSEQLGLAAESNRLYETSQRIAQREALVNEISTRLQSGTSVEMTLTSAARSLKDVLKANRVAIRLGKPPIETSNGGNS